MGRKANNLPARLARKKKIKDKNNLQIQGRAGLGRRREKGRSERQKQRQKPREKPVDPPVAQLSYVELAKQQEQKAEAATTQPLQVVQAPQSKKARRKQRKRTQQEAERSETWEKSHVIPKADLKRDDTLYFGEDRAQEGNDGEEKGPLPKASAIELSPGMLVRIAGLKNMTTLNGETCTLQSWNVAAERWSVRIEGNDKLLKKENLEVKALLRPHTPVRLIGLRMQELNGKNGLCREWKAEKSRWLVAVEGHGDVLMKAENLEVLLKPGLQVQLCGLQTSELNGAEAVCLAPLQGRWRVRLEGGAEKALRPENLAVLSQEATFCPAVTQHVEVLEAEEKPSRLLCILRDVQEAERKGLVQRSLTLVFCLEASIAPVSLALGQRQVACLKLTASNQQERLKGFHLDGKRVLLCTDEALSAYGASSIPEVARAVSYDLPDLQCHRKRLERLNKSGEEPGGCYHAFVTDQVPAEVCRGLCEMLQAARIPIHPRLKELSTREASQKAEAPTVGKKRRRRRSSRAKDASAARKKCKL